MNVSRERLYESLMIVAAAGCNKLCDWLVGDRKPIEMPRNHELKSRKEAARYLSVSAGTIDRYRKEGKLKDVFVGNTARPRFRVSQLDALVAARN